MRHVQRKRYVRLLKTPARRQEHDRLQRGADTYNAGWMRALLAVLTVVCAMAAWGQDSGFSLDLAYQRDRPVDRVLGRVSANADRWIGERDFEAINRSLKRIAGALVEDPGSFEPLAAETGRFARLELAEFKIVSTARDASDSSLVHVRVRVELGGQAAEGGLLSLVSHAKMTWGAAEGSWTPVATELGDFLETGAAQRGFTEITGSVFGGIESFREQLSHSVDHWRDSMDAALGVSVYGHQGISLGDADGDGLEDLYISQPGGLPNRLYRNNGNGTFSDWTRRAGLDVLDETSMSLFADVDNDGDQDLVLIGAVPMLFRNRGDGRFSLDRDAGLDVTSDQEAMFTGAAIADYDLDGDLDLYVCAYDFWQSGGDYDAPTPYFDAVNGPANLLFRNDGQGSFEEVARKSGLEPTNNRFSFAAAWADYDDDGDPDLYVANDFGRNNLYRNNGDGTFSDWSTQSGVEDLGAGMSAAWGDYDGDGDLDLYTANMWSSAGLRITGSTQFRDVADGESELRKFRQQARGNSLFRNDGPAGFRDVSEEAGVRTGRWAWASDFVDLDGDGRLDLFVQNGFITGERMDDL